MATIAECEGLRHIYKPSVIRVLFVGESPPANGTFFYAGDSKLVHYSEKAFREVFGSFPNFLAFFKEKGCYLDDLCPDKYLNHLEKKLGKKEGKKLRKTYRQQGIEPLAQRIRELQPAPLAFVVVMKGIEVSVRKAIQQAGLAAHPTHILNFPAESHEQQYKNGLIAALNQLRDINILE